MSDYGSPDDPEEFRALRAFSPYHNVGPRTVYPPTLIATGDHDDRVFPAHSYKFAAALQAVQAGSAPVLIRIDSLAGHGIGKPLSKIIAELTDQLAFLVHHLEMYNEQASPNFSPTSGCNRRNGTTCFVTLHQPPRRIAEDTPADSSVASLAFRTISAVSP